jgi:hypothetical protein
MRTFLKSAKSAKSLKSRRSETGLTMIEVVVASIILFALVTMSSYLVWNTSRTVSSMEVGVQMEIQAREFITQLQKEFHQTSFKFNQVWVVDWDATLPAPLPLTAFNPGTATPGTKHAYTTKVSAYYPGADGIIPNGPFPAPAATVFHALRFKIPGKTMDLTTLNANYDAPVPPGQQKNFDLKGYLKAQSLSVDPPDYTTEIQYWWEFDQTNFKNEGTLAGGIGPIGPGGFQATGTDLNGNGISDEGVIKRLETTYDVNGNVLKRSVSTVLRDVQWDAANNRPGLVFCIPGADPAGTLYPLGTERRLFVSVTMERVDPQNARKKSRNFVKQIATYLDVRNY